MSKSTDYLILGIQDTKYVGEDRMCTKEENISTPYQTFKDIIHKYNSTVEDESLKLPNIPLHELRHTSATVLISADADVRTVSARLGHAQTSTTMNIYAHSLKESDKTSR